MLNPAAGPPIDSATAEQIAKTWWVLFVSGLVSVVVGIVVLSVRWTVADLAFVMALLFVVRGTFRTASIPVDGSGRRWTLITGLLEVFVGLAFVAWPDATLLTLAIFIGSWIVVTGAFDIVGGVSRRHDVPLWWLYLVVGLIEVPLGLILLDRPLLTLGLAIAMAGVWSAVVGLVQIAVAFEVKNLPRHPHVLGR